MQASDGQHNSETQTVLRTVQMVATVGFVYSLATLARAAAPIAEWRLILYTTWFAITVVSIEAILRWMKAGVYALVLATLAVTVTDMFEGVATVGGASLGLLIAFIIVGYVRPEWEHFD